jgi:hypothetical protein
MHEKSDPPQKLFFIPADPLRDGRERGDPKRKVPLNLGQEPLILCCERCWIHEIEP